MKSATPAALVVIAAGWFALDRLALPDVMALPGGEMICRARIVAPPAGRPDAEQPSNTVFVRPAGGPHEGQVLAATYSATAASPRAGLVGKSVFVEFAPRARPEVRAIARDRVLLALAAGLAGLIVLTAGGSAWRLMLVLLAGLAGLVLVLAPCLAAGVPPLLAAGLTGAGLMLVAAVLIGRAGRVSVGIFVGGAGGLAVAAGLAALAVAAGRLTGVYSKLTEDLWRNVATRGLDFPQLLCAGMIVGGCGIILDLATAVASAVQQVAQANPALNRRQLAAAGLAVGRDVMGTELNTLIFAYAGAHIGVVLLPVLGQRLPGYGMPALRILSQQDVAVEIFAMVVGTAALVLTIPITATVSAALLAGGTAQVGSEGLSRAGPAALSAGGRRRRPAKIAAWLATAAALGAAWLACTWWQGRAGYRFARRPGDPPGFSRYLLQADVQAAHPPAQALAGRHAAEQLQRLTCKVRSRTLQGRVLEVINPVSGFPGSDKLMRPGDQALLNTVLEDGEVNVSVMDFSRGGWLIHFAFLLAAVILAVGGRKGLRAILALGLSAAVLYPAVLAVGAGGWPALPTLLAAALPLCAGVFLVLAGPTRKALAGSAGAFGGLLAGSLCAVAAASVLALSGLQSDAMAAIRNYTRSGQLDYAGLLQAGMALGVAGATMDVAIAIASAADQVRRVKPAASRRELFARGLTVGRGIMIPMVLVLLLAYVGLNLPILLLPKMHTGQPLAVLVSNERISVEVLRILVAGIGVVVTVPITAAVAALVGGRAAGRSDATPGHRHNHPGGP